MGPVSLKYITDYFFMSYNLDCLCIHTNTCPWRFKTKKNRVWVFVKIILPLLSVVHWIRTLVTVSMELYSVRPVFCLRNNLKFLFGLQDVYVRSTTTNPVCPEVTEVFLYWWTTSQEEVWILLFVPI